MCLCEMYKRWVEGKDQYYTVVDLQFKEQEARNKNIYTKISFLAPTFNVSQRQSGIIGRRMNVREESGLS